MLEPANQVCKSVMWSILLALTLWLLPVNMLEHYGQASFKTQSYHDDNMEDHLFQGLPTKLMMPHGLKRSRMVMDMPLSHLLLREPDVGEAHDMHRAASASAKLEASLWKNKASFPFKMFLTRMSKAFKELEDAGQPCDWVLNMIVISWTFWRCMPYAIKNGLDSIHQLWKCA